MRTNSPESENLTPTDRLCQPTRVILSRVPGSGFEPSLIPGPHPGAGGEDQSASSSSSSADAAENRRRIRTPASFLAAFLDSEGEKAFFYPGLCAPWTCGRSALHGTDRVWFHIRHL